MQYMFLLTAPQNAAREVLDNPQYAGALHTVQTITGIIDNGFAIFITLVAFFIIMAGLAKNVVAGAYVAWPDLWDKVDECHQQYKINMGLFKKDNVTKWLNGNIGGEGGGGAGQHSTIAMIIYTLLPNFKAMTPWKSDGGDSPEGISARDYFIKAIPQMVAVVFIGIFIYNGFYKDVTIKMTDFGSEAFHRVISKADPMAMVDRAIGTLNKPTFESSLGKDMKSQLTNRLSNDIYDKTVSIYSDIASPEVQRQVAQTIERTVEAFLDEAVTNIGAAHNETDLFNSDRYSARFTVQRVAGTTDQGTFSANNTNPSRNRVRESGVDQYYQWLAIPNIQETLNFENATLIAPNDNYSLNIVVVWTRKLERAESNSSKTIREMQVTASLPAIQASGPGATINIPVSGVVFSARNASGTINGSPVTISADSALGQLTITNAGSTAIAANAGPLIVNNSSLQWVAGDGFSHRVAQVVFGASSFRAEGTDGSISTDPATSPRHASTEEATGE